MMRWNFHGYVIEGATNDDALAQSWQTLFASLPSSMATADLRCQLDIVPQIPPLPSGNPKYRQGDLLSYYVTDNHLIAHFPRFGQMHLNLAEGTTKGELVTAVLQTYGVLEDIIAIALSPHLRRRGLYLVHAFAAACEGHAILLVGDIGAGKTTTGMALLNDGWQLLSNDSPIINQNGEILSYPGALTAYPETFARFAATRHVSKQIPTQNGRQKVSIPATQIWPDVWLPQASLAAIFFPKIEARANHVVERLPAPTALMRLLPHTMEQWDRAMMPKHLSTLRQLVETTPAYQLRLGSDVQAIAPVLRKVIR